MKVFSTPIRRLRWPLFSGDMTWVRADELGWQGLENGALLDAAERAAFDLLGQIVKLDVAQF